MIAFIVFMERGKEEYNPISKKTSRHESYASQASHLPLKINTAGVIPPIFASSIYFCQ